MIITQLKSKVAPNLLPKIESWYSKLSLNGHTSLPFRNLHPLTAVKCTLKYLKTKRFL